VSPRQVTAHGVCGRVLPCSVFGIVHVAEATPGAPAGARQRYPAKGNQQA
jgi:hypothetical protein